MRIAFSFVVAACLIGVAVPAQAQLIDGDVTMEIVAEPPSATLSTASLATYATYRVTLTKRDTPDSRHEQFRFNASTAVEGSAETATFFVASGATCGPIGATAIECTVDGELTTTGQTLSFAVTFKTPGAGTAITLTGTSLMLETHVPSGNTFFEATNPGTASTALTAPDPATVSTYVPAATTATTLFTGLNGGAATPLDTWTTTVTVPALSQATTASVAETVSAVTCAAGLLTCSTSALAIPGMFANLTIILRRDATTIARHARIASAKIFYDNPSHADPRIVYPLQLLPCSDTTYGPLPQLGIPCIASRTDYPDRSSRKHPVPAGFEGDWEFMIFALDNGRYVN